jgi:hypothetical protein
MSISLERRGIEMTVQQYMIARLQKLMDENEGIRKSVERIVYHPNGYFQSNPMGNKFLKIARRALEGGPNP